MPTGYTAGILDGTTKNFKEFAKQCTRAFMIHLKDEPIDVEYVPRTHTDYHTKKITESKRTLKEIELVKDEAIINTENKRLLDDIKYHEDAITTKAESELKLNEFLIKAKAYKPPTETHKGIAKFMVEQIESTIDFDCKDNNYHENNIIELKEKLKVLDADCIRGEMRVSATESIAYHTKEHEAELKRCRESNEWYNEFINSI